MQILAVADAKLKKKTEKSAKKLKTYDNKIKNQEFIF